MKQYGSIGCHLAPLPLLSSRMLMPEPRCPLPPNSSSLGNGAANTAASCAGPHLFPPDRDGGRRPKQTGERPTSPTHSAASLLWRSRPDGGADCGQPRHRRTHTLAACCFCSEEGEDCGYVVDDGDGESSLDRGSAMFVLSSLPSDCTVLRLRWVGKMDERDREGEGEIPFLPPSGARTQSYANG